MPRFRPGLARARREAATLAALALALAASPAATRDWPGTIDVRGNVNLSLHEINEAIDSVACVAGDSTCVERICRALAEAYWSRGYVEAEVRCEHGETGLDTLRVSISEGTLDVLDAVKFDGVDSAAAPAVASIFGDVVAKPLLRSEIEDRIGRMLDFYDQRGHPLAKAEPDFSSLGGGKVHLLLKVDQGPRAAVGKIILRGAKHTKESALLPEMGIRAGQAYDGRKMEMARSNLARLGIFATVSEPVLAFDARDTTVSVTFDLTEAPTSFIDGAIGYAPGARGSRLAGTARLELTNLGGTLRRARILWSRPADDRLSWSLYYREPRILRMPFAVEGSLASDVVDTSYARRKFSVGVVYVGEPGLEIGAGTLLGSSKDRTVSGGEGTFSEKGVSLSVSREGRQRPANPTSGTFFEARHEIESLNYAGDLFPDRTLSNLDVRSEVIIPIASSTKVALNNRFLGAFSSTSSVPASHMIRLGGLSTLRGYPEDWFRCEKAFTASLEVRRILGPESRVHVFFDAATLETETLSMWRSGDAAFGYGVGVMAAAGRTLLRVEVAAGRGDRWVDAKLHLGIVQEF